jgi:trimeric autotransporter adhesin
MKVSSSPDHSGACPRSTSPLHIDFRSRMAFRWLLVLTGALSLEAFGAGLARSQPSCVEGSFGSDVASAIAVSGNTIYLGGVGFVGSCTGGGVPFSVGTGSIVPGFPKVDGRRGYGPLITAAASDGSGGWFIGGDFTSVGGLPRAGLAHILSDMSVSPWNPGADLPVYTIAVNGSTLYVGGTFQHVGGIQRSYVAAVDASTGAVNPDWNPNPDDGISALVVSGSTVYAGGSFTIIGGAARTGIAALEAATGNATSWDPNCDGQVSSIAVSGTVVYVGGYFTQIGGSARENIAAVRTSNATATAWNPGANGDVFSLASSGSAVYAAGFFTGIGGAVRNHLAALNTTNGNATSWNPGPDSPVHRLAMSGTTLYAVGEFVNIGGAARARVASFDLSTGALTSWNPGANDVVRALAVSGSNAYVGGDFYRAGGVERRGLAAIDATTGELTSWNPALEGGGVGALAVSGSTVYVGGSFTSVEGVARNRLAAIDATTGAVTPWNPNVIGLGAYVGALVVSGSTVFAGGFFRLVSDSSRIGLAAIDVTTGQATSWNAHMPDGPCGPCGPQINALILDGSTLYVGGGFYSVQGMTRNNLAALDAATAQLLPWNPDANAPVSAMVLDGSRMYVAGGFYQIGGLSQSRLAALQSTGAGAAIPGWDPMISNGDISTLALNGGRLYVGGTVTDIDGQSRARLASLEANSGVVSGWNPGANAPVASIAVGPGKIWVGGLFTMIDGTLRSGFAALNPDTTVLVGVEPTLSASDAMALAPNPSTGMTRIFLDLPLRGRVRVSVLDVQGREVALIADEVREAGRNEVVWAHKSRRPVVKPGIYFVRAERPGLGPPLVRRLIVLD